MSPAEPGAPSLLVVGAGPVGLTLAAHLHHHGLRCRIIDRSPTASDKSKALVLWARSLEMLGDLGIVDRFLASGFFLNAACLHGSRRLLARIPFTTAGTEYPRPLMLAQSETERLLTEHLREVGIPIERQVELTDFSDRGDHVLATLRHADGRTEEMRCDYLFGCDGAHSTVRKKAGLEFTGEAEPNDWVLADCHVEGPIPQDVLSLFWHSQGVLAFFPFGRDRCRLIADMGMAAPGTSHPADPSLAQMQAIVDERGPAGVRLSEPHWLSGFRIHERQVAEYRRGRAFLLGDAAHIHSPAGGQGMNTGMQDAWNLAWKVALVLKGRAKPELLDSYSAERHAVGQEVLRQAGRMTRMAIMRGPIKQFFRNRVVSLLGMLPFFRHGFLRYLSELAVHYPNSPLNGEKGSASFSPGAVKPGDRVPDAHLIQQGTNRKERLLKLLQGTSHHLLLLSGADIDDPALKEVGERVEALYPDLIRVHAIVPGKTSPASTPPRFPSTWLDPDGVVRKQLGATQPALALVRPDGYLAFRGQPALWRDLDEYLRRYLIPTPKGPA